MYTLQLTVGVPLASRSYKSRSLLVIQNNYINCACLILFVSTAPSSSKFHIDKTQIKRRQMSAFQKERVIGDNKYYMIKFSSLLADSETSDPDQIFELLDVLGQGAYGSVSKALHKPTGKLYAIKILPATSIAEIETIKKEIQILKLCDNEHIVKFYGHYLKDNNLWIVLEYCIAGSVIDLINITQRKLSQFQIASILDSVLRGLVYLHERKKIHRDIKAANILLNQEGVAKLADFGVSTESKFTNAVHRTQAGSPYWMSPEVMKSSEYTSKTDIWSLGVTAIELAEGVVPNSNLKPLQAMWRLRDNPIQQLKEPQKWSPEFNSFVRDCLQINPELRPDAKVLLNHDFITSKSRGSSLLAELVAHSLEQIELFRVGQQQSQPDRQEILNFLNSSGLAHETKTIINNMTARSRQSKDISSKNDRLSQNLASSMIVNDQANGSMIINQNNTNTAINQQSRKPTNYLNQYINQMKSNDHQIDHQKQTIITRIGKYDRECLRQIQAVFAKYKNIITKGLGKDFQHHQTGIDHEFIQKQVSSKILACENVKKFISSFQEYKDQETQKIMLMNKKPAELVKKKSQSSQNVHRISRNEPRSEISEFKESNIRGVKSLQFNYVNKRFIATEPHEYIAMERKPLQNENHLVNGQKTKLKQFLLDPDVKQSLLNHMYNGCKTTDKKSEASTNNRHLKSNIEGVTQYQTQFFSDEWKSSSKPFTKYKQSLNRNQNSEQEYLILDKHEAEMEHKIQLFKAKGSETKGNKKDNAKQKGKVYKNSIGIKRQGHSGQKKAPHTKIQSNASSIFTKNKSIANFVK